MSAIFGVHQVCGVKTYQEIEFGQLLKVGPWLKIFYIFLIIQLFKMPSIHTFSQTLLFDSAFANRAQSIVNIDPDLVLRR